MKLNEQQFDEAIKYLEESQGLISFKTPEELYKWMDKNIKYYLEGEEYNDASKMLTQTADEIMKSKRGHCAEQSYLEKKILDGLGYKTYLIHAKENNSKKDMGSEGNTHVFLIYEDNGKKCWFENSMEHHKGIEKYNSFKDLFNNLKDVWWKYDKTADILEIRFLDKPITGVNNAKLAKECHKFPVKYTLDIKNAVLEKDMR